MCLVPSDIIWVKLINQTIEKINKRGEEYRRRTALAASLLVFVSVLGVWSVQKGYLDFGSNNSIISKDRDISEIAKVESAPSPLDSSKGALNSIWSEINKTYIDFKDSVSSVFVPFITGIEVYERK